MSYSTFVKSSSSAFRALPNTDSLLQSEELSMVIDIHGRNAVKAAIREELEYLRAEISDNNSTIINQVLQENFFGIFCEDIISHLESIAGNTLISVINLTGTVIHTNLGRARLPDKAVTAMSLVASNPSNLEYDLETGKRGDRDSHLEKLLCDITGAEAATVVNNNAAAVLLVLNTLAVKKEVIISRGELVEIGGAFRIPEVMISANCILREVGTTNRTHLKDYQSAINSDTGVLMKVHTSNYEIKGFTGSIAETELSALARENNLHFVSDLGSGTLVDIAKYGLPREPTVSDALKGGADVVTFSGDKLLGGPQAGLIVGKKSLIQEIKQNPLKRALRVDKVTIAALAEVLKLYTDPDRLAERLPVLKSLTRDTQELQELAEKLLPFFVRALASVAEITIEPCKSQIGSGALPLDLLDSSSLVLKPLADEGKSDAKLQSLVKKFRGLSTPIVGRLHDGKLIFDLRCLEDESELLDLLNSTSWS